MYLDQSLATLRSFATRLVEIVSLRIALRTGPTRAQTRLLVIVGLTLLAVTFAGTPSSPQASGTGGSGSWPYVNGVICDSSGAQVPLVAWQLAGVNGPAFLTSGI